MKLFKFEEEVYFDKLLDMGFKVADVYWEPFEGNLTVELVREDDSSWEEVYLHLLPQKGFYEDKVIFVTEGVLYRQHSFIDEDTYRLLSENHFSTVEEFMNHLNVNV